MAPDGTQPSPITRLITFRCGTCVGVIRIVPLGSRLLSRPSHRGRLGAHGLLPHSSYGGVAGQGTHSVANQFLDRELDDGPTPLEPIGSHLVTRRVSTLRARASTLPPRGRRHTRSSLGTSNAMSRDGIRSPYWQGTRH